MGFWDEIWRTKQNISENDLKITQIRLPSKEEVVEGKEYTANSEENVFRKRNGNKLQVGNEMI